MAQYLIRKIKDSTGHTFTEVIKLRENERYEIVSAESKEEEERLYRAVQLKNGLSGLIKGTSNLSKTMQGKDSE